MEALNLPLLGSRFITYVVTPCFGAGYNQQSVFFLALFVSFHISISSHLRFKMVNITVQDAFYNVLRAYNLTTIFGNPGSTGAK